jgi:DNA repair protein RadC
LLACFIQFGKQLTPNLPNRRDVLYILEVGRQLKHHKFIDAAVVLAGANAAQEFLSPIFSERDQEIMIVAYCDERLRLLELLALPGQRESVAVSIPHIFRCTGGCGGIILAHNHPSGDVRPSEADHALTRRVGLFAEALEVTLLDHLIFGSGKMFSFRRSGLL